MLTKIKQMLGMTIGDDMLGSISTFAGSYAPEGYLDCDGRMLSVHDYTALYAIIGTTYGGDGKNNFALPDLRPFNKDGQPDTGRHYKVDWYELRMPRQVICIRGQWPSRG